MEKKGIKVGLYNSEIKPKKFKLTITMESNENVATFTVWDKGIELPITADVVVLNVPNHHRIVSKTIKPKQAKELIEAFEELTKLLTVQA